MPASITLWDRTTPADNDDADSGINWLEGQLPSTVNGSARAMMERIAEYYYDMGAVNTVGGTADAITVTLNDGATAYVTGQHFRFIAGGTNTGAATMNVNSIGAKAIRKISGGTDAALVAGDIADGGYYDLVYDSAANSAAGAWILLNPSPATINLTGGQIAFPATQNASSDANTLDDYDEGTTWTPAFTFATPGDLSVAYLFQGGWTLKIGKFVMAFFYVATSSFTHTTASGAAKITGLPFTSEDTSNTAGFGQAQVQGITKTNYTQFFPRIGVNEDFISFIANGSGQAGDLVTAADMPTGGDVILRGMLLYRASS